MIEGLRRGFVAQVGLISNKLVAVVALWNVLNVIPTSYTYSTKLGYVSIRCCWRDFPTPIIIGIFLFSYLEYFLLPGELKNVNVM